MIRTFLQTSPPNSLYFKTISVLNPKQFISAFKIKQTMKLAMLRVPKVLIQSNARSKPAILQRVITRAQSNAGGRDLPARPDIPGGLPSLWSSPRLGLSSPFSIIRQMERDLDSVFRHGFGLDALESPLSASSLSLAVDVKENENSYEIACDVPGMSQIKIEVSPDRVLNISGERKNESKKEEKGVVRMERSYGSFERAFRLPDNVDIENINAQVEKGVLKLIVPKAQVDTEKKTIKVEISE